LDVIERSVRLFDRIWVAVVENPSKTPLLSAAERVRLCASLVKRHSTVEVLAFAGLTVDLAASLGARWIVRGLRSESDAAGEIAMARSNERCGRSLVETILVPSRPEVAFVSSSLVRQIAERGGRLDAFVPPIVRRALEARCRPGGDARSGR
jgi:pantetheine-phosphate adenylyltransferase